MSDWIKIHRSILDSYAFANPVSLKIWTWMLLKANYKNSYIPLTIGKGITSVKVNRGQFIFGRNRAEIELEMDGSMIYRQIKKFEDLKQIIIEPNNQFSLITICNYDTYQSRKDNDEQQMNSKRTASEQQANNERTAGEHKEEELESKESKEYIDPRKSLTPELAKVVCYDAEQFLLANQIAMEQICMAASKKMEVAKKELRLYHLWMVKNNKYPTGNNSVIAGFEGWLLNSGRFNNGNFAPPVELSDYQQDILNKRLAAKNNTAKW